MQMTNEMRRSLPTTLFLFDDDDGLVVDDDDPKLSSSMLSSIVFPSVTDSDKFGMVIKRAVFVTTRMYVHTYYYVGSMYGR